MDVRLLYATAAQIGNWLERTGNRKPETGTWKPRTGSWKLETGSWKLVLAVAIEERLEGTAQLRREIVFVDRVEQRHGGLIGLELCDAPGARSQVPLQFRVYRRRQMMLHEVRQEAHEIGAAAFF
jgi:hypothetical protein